MILKRDSFDNYTTVSQRCSVLNGTTSPDIGAYGRFSTNGLRIRHGGGGGTNVSKSIPSTQTIIVGFAFKPNVINPSTLVEIVAFTDSGSRQVEIDLQPTGNIIVSRNGTPITSASANTLLAGNYYYIEVKVKIDNTTGTVEVRVNGSVTGWINDTGLDTQTSVNASANSIKFGSNTRTADVDFRYDDLVIMDTTTTHNNDFLGDVRIECVFPDADATNTDWTPSSGGTHFDDVDETPPNEDTDYIESTIATDKDTFTHPGLVTATGDVFDVAVILRHKKSGAGTSEIRAIVIGDPAGTPTEDQGANIAQSTDYLTEESGFDENPDTVAPWLISEVNSMEFGVERVS